jgi:predicted acylesterase/phospholipase RssA
MEPVAHVPPECRNTQYTQYTHIVMSGGGMAALTYMGALGVLQDRLMTGSIQHICGTSMGAFFGCLLAMDIPMVEVSAYLRGYFEKEHIFFPLTAVMNILDVHGLDDGQFLLKPLHYFMEQRFEGADVAKMTFVEFTKLTGKVFTVCASNIDKHERCMISVDTHPDAFVTQAVLASMAVPMLIQPVVLCDKHGHKDRYVDGGITDNFPSTQSINSHSTLGLKVDMRMLPEKVGAGGTDSSSSLIHFLLSLATTTFASKSRVKAGIESANVLHMDKCPLPSFPICFEDDGFSFVIPEEKIKESVEYGRVSMEQFIDRETPR